MSQITAVSIRKLGSHRGCPRVWLQGRIPATAGFTPQTRFAAIKDAKNRKVTLKIESHGNRMVSRKLQAEKYIPVIDINSAEVLAMFEGLEHIRITARNGEIVIECLESERRAQARLERIQEKMAAGVPLFIGSVSHGGGILSKALHDGLAKAGVKAKLAFGNDIREELIDHAGVANPVWDKQTIHLAAPLQELAFDQEVMSSLPQVDILEAGLPCEASSLSGRAKNGTSCAEEHPLVGHLVVSFLALVARVNPALVCVENVPPYQATASMHIMRNQLRDFGYEVHEVVLNSGEWGVLEHRKRLCMVAVTAGMKFNFDDLVIPHIGAPTLGQILDPIGPDNAAWSPMEYLFAKAERDAAEGKGFAMQILTEDATKVGTIGKGYYKNRSTEPKLQHPSKRLYRLFTSSEHARVKGIDEALVEGLSQTTAHELLGQSITPTPFRAVGELLGTMLKSFATPGAIDCQTIVAKPSPTFALKTSPVINVTQDSSSDQACLF